MKDTQEGGCYSAEWSIKEGGEGSLKEMMPQMSPREGEALTRGQDSPGRKKRKCPRQRGMTQHGATAQEWGWLRTPSCFVLLQMK